MLNSFFSTLPAKFGANAILGVSLAVCKAGAAERDLPLYRHIAQLAGNSDLILPVPVSLVSSRGEGDVHAGEGKKGKGQLERKGGDVEPEPGTWGSWRSHPRGRREGSLAPL